MSLAERSAGKRALRRRSAALAALNLTPRVYLWHARERRSPMPSSELSPEKKAALRDVTSQIRTLRGRAAGVLYELGVLLRRVEDEELWRAGPYTSLSDYLERGVDVSETTARRCIQVTRHFNLEMAQRYGLDKLSRGLRYLELTGKAEKPGDLVAADLRNRGPDGRFVKVPFNEATSRQIDEAIRIELERREARAHKAPEGMDDRLRRMSEAMPSLPGGVRAVKRRVEATKTRGGEVVLTFRQVPMSELRAFVAALEREMLGEVEG